MFELFIFPILTGITITKKKKDRETESASLMRKQSVILVT